MSAVAYQLPVQVGRPHLRLVESSPAPSMQAVYRRRRIVAAFVAIALALAAATAINVGVSWAWNQVTSRPAVTAPVPVAAVGPETVVVQPGDSLWSIATRANPGADVRPLVSSMAKARNGAPLQVGERIALP